MLRQAGELLAEECAVPELLRGALREQIEQIRALNEQIKTLERRISCWQRRAEDCQRIGEIPGVGLLTATAAVAMIGDAEIISFGGLRRGFRRFSAAPVRELVERSSCLGISKRGDRYLRTLLIHGARAVLRWQSRPRRELDRWSQKLTIAAREKRGNCMALANKMARMILGTACPRANVSKGLRRADDGYRSVSWIIFKTGMER